MWFSLLTLRFMFLLALLFPQSSYAFWNIKKFFGISCKKELQSHSAADSAPPQAIIIAPPHPFLEFEKRLAATNGSSMENRLLLLEELSSNPSFTEALKNSQFEAKTLLWRIAAHHGNTAFAKKLIAVLNKFSDPISEATKKEIQSEIPPSDLEKASSFPKDAFLASTPSIETQAKLSSFFDNDAYLEPESVTRRIFAFMTDNQELSQNEKANLFAQLISTFQGLQRNASIEEADVFHSRKLTDASGNIIFCGEECAFYYVIDKNGSFFSAKTKNPPGIDSEKAVLKDWRKISQFIYQAGVEAPINEQNP